MSRSQVNPADLRRRHEEAINEDTPLIQEPQSLWASLQAIQYCSPRKCVSSKAALLILLWSFLIGLLSGMLLNPDLIILTIIVPIFNVLITFFIYMVIAFITCFFPLAGILADIKHGRYKTIVTSVCLVLLSVSLLLLSGIVVTILFLFTDFIIAICVLSVCVGSAIFVLYAGLIGFTANVVQFGMDQLHDSPGEDRTLFIHWYVWTYYGSILIGQFAWYLTARGNFVTQSAISGYCLVALILLLQITVLPVTLCLVRHRRRWFLIEPGQYNPYKLVYRVTKFARQHKTPVRRSAFTYCEDEVPRGLDLGKDKYGGPFTTEQVEDVKAFYGILKVLFSFGVVFFLDFAADSMLPLFTLHMQTNADPSGGTLILINKGLFSPLLIVICIPLYLCFHRPSCSKYVPGMLKRMGLGMVLVLLSLLTTLSMDTATHMAYSNFTSCMFVTINEFRSPFHVSSLVSNLLIIQLILSALSRILIYTGVFEFICSQSPHSMKGLLIGMLYAIRGLYQMVAALLVVPYNFLGARMYPSCEFYFYFMNIIIGLVAVLVYVWVAKKYRYRMRDEPCNVRQYAEEYYSNPHQERFYDYD